MIQQPGRWSYLLTRVLDDGRVIDVMPLTFGRARIVVSRDLADVGPYDGW